MKARAKSVVDCIKAMLCPDRYNTPSASSTEHRADILKDLPIQATFQTITPTALGNGSGGTVTWNENVPSSSGMILWQVCRGLFSMYRMHFVTANTTTYCNTAIGSGLANSPNLTLAQASPHLPFTTFALAGGGTNLPAYGNLSSITYTSQLALPVLPVLGTTNSDIITFDANIPNEIGFTRLYAGQISIDSATVSIGNTTLAGTFSAASVADTRDIAQVLTAAYPVANIASSSETGKDYLYQVPVNQGVSAVMGADVQNDYVNPSQDNVVIDNGNYAVFNTSLNAYSSVAFYVPDTWANPYFGGVASAFKFSSYALAQIWVSPWNCTVGTNITFPSQAATVLNLSGAAGPGPIAETGCLKFKVRSQGFFANGGNVDAVTLMEHGCLATHVFAGVALSGQIYYTTYIEKRSLIVGQANSMPTMANPASTGQLTGQTADFDPSFFRQGMLIDGKYIGTFLQFYVTPLVSSATGNYTQTPFFFPPPTIYICAPDIDVAGEIGPVRILRWDNISTGATAATSATINLSGKLWCQGIPTAALAPYVKGGVMARLRLVPPEALELAMRLFNSSSPCCRIWNKVEYERFCREVVYGLTETQLIDWAIGAGPSAESAAQAAGLFGTIAHGIGHIADMFGAAGQFGYQGAGQFGAQQQTGMGQMAAGQFGYQSAGGYAPATDYAFSSGNRRSRDGLQTQAGSASY